MKHTLKAALAAGLAWTAAATPGQTQTQPFPAPTTRMLAIGTITPGASLDSVRAILPTEVRETVKLYLAGKIDQWFSLADRSGVVFLLNVKDPNDAHMMLEALPLGQAHLMEFQLLPLAPLAPLRQLPGFADGSP